jgi:diguanylate cyclase (GGDEF)-like protein
LGELLAITQKLNQQLTLESALREVASASTRLVPADTASVMLVDNTKRLLLCKATCGLTEEEISTVAFQSGEGIAGWVVASGDPVLLGNAEDDSRFKKIEGQTRTIKSMICVPLKTPEEILGVITVTAADPDRFNLGHSAILGLLANHIVKEIQHTRLYRLAVTDPLTRVFNRQHLSERLPVEFERTRRYERPLSMMMVDVDNFKDVNDSYGHHIGDIALQEIARECVDISRESDLVVRYGGEEFLIVLSDTDLEGALILAERLRQSIEAESFAAPQANIHLTVSIGVAQIMEHDTRPDELIQRADEALYEAKHKGKNRVETKTTTFN